MGRPPEENTARSETVAFRIGSELSLMEKRLAETGESRSRYLRRLISEDANRKAPAPRRKPRDLNEPVEVLPPHLPFPIRAITIERGGTKWPRMEQYEIGSRWADRDSRNVGRVVEVKAMVDGASSKRVIEVEAHPTNPSAVGHRTVVSTATLDKRYRKVSR